PQRDHDQHLHAGPRPEPGGLRQAGCQHLQGEGVLHQYDDAGAVHSDGFHEAEDEAGELRGKWASYSTCLPNLPWRGFAVLAATLWAGCGGGGGHGSAYATPLNPKQAPLVTVRQLLQADSLIGRRVRVVGTCALAGAGPSTGAWVLQDGGFSIEVRGLVPASCFRQD